MIVQEWYDDLPSSWHFGDDDGASAEWIYDFTNASPSSSDDEDDGNASDAEETSEGESDQDEN